MDRPARELGGNPPGPAVRPAAPVQEINLATIELTRSDGIGGSVAPHEGPPGPHSVFADVATPFGDPAATDCGCHALLGDGTLDLLMKFHRPTLVSVLNLNNLPSGAFVPLKIRGNLEDGTPFEARDCIRLVPP